MIKFKELNEFKDYLNNQTFTEIEKVKIPSISYRMIDDKNLIKINKTNLDYIELDDYAFSKFLDINKTSKQFIKSIKDDPDLIEYIINRQINKNKGRTNYNFRMIDNKITGISTNRIKMIDIRDFVNSMIDRKVDVDLIITLGDKTVFHTKPMDELKITSEEIFNISNQIKFSETFMHPFVVNQMLERLICTNGVVTENKFDSMIINSSQSKDIDSNIIIEMIKSNSNNEFKAIFDKSINKMREIPIPEEGIEKVERNLISHSKNHFSEKWFRDIIEENNFEENPVFYNAFNIISQIGRDYKEIDYEESMKHQIKSGEILTFFSNYSDNKDKRLLQIL